MKRGWRRLVRRCGSTNAVPGRKRHTWSGSSGSCVIAGASGPPRRMPNSRGDSFRVWSGRGVSAATQKQALSAIRFVFAHGLESPLPWLEGFTPASRPPRLPVVLSPNEVDAVLSQLSGARRLIGMQLYASGLRLMEAISLRVKDLNSIGTRSLCAAERVPRTGRRCCHRRCTSRCGRIWNECAACTAATWRREWARCRAPRTSSPPRQVA